MSHLPLFLGGSLSSTTSVLHLLDAVTEDEDWDVAEVTILTDVTASVRGSFSETDGLLSGLLRPSS